MDLENMKANWKQTGSGKKDQNELLNMTKITNHPKLKKLRLKFIIEATLISIFVVVYYNGFDGQNKPLWANIFLIAAAVAYIVVRFSSWQLLKNPVKKCDLKSSLNKFESELKVMALSIWLSALGFGLGIILFFASSIELTTEKYIYLGFMLLSLVALIYVSTRNWKNRITSINNAIQEFE